MADESTAAAGGSGGAPAPLALVAGVASRVRWWHVCLATGAGLALLTAIGWAGERWGGGPVREGVQRISGARRPRRGGGGGGRGGGRGRWRGGRRGGGGGSKKTPETKVARVKQEIKQVLLWVERMEQRVTGLPRMDDVLNASSSSSSSTRVKNEHDGLDGAGADDHRAGESKEESDDGVVTCESEGLGQWVRRACINKFEEEWSPAASGATGEQRQHVESLLVSFVRLGIDRQRANFRRSQLSPFARYAVYETSERLGLTHRKEGDAIIVSKLKFVIPVFDEDEPAQNGSDLSGEMDAPADPTQDVTSNKEEEGDAHHDQSSAEDRGAQQRRANLERCKILEECLTIALLDLDSLVDCGEALPREERKQLVQACQQLLAVIEAWKTYFQDSEGTAEAAVITPS